MTYCTPSYSTCLLVENCGSLSYTPSIPSTRCTSTGSEACQRYITQPASLHDVSPMTSSCRGLLLCRDSQSAHLQQSIHALIIPLALLLLGIFGRLLVR